MTTITDIELSRKEYLTLPETEWRKDYFDEATGGYVATHKMKTPDDMSILGIAAEVNACYEMASIGKHVLRLPENIPELINNITISGKPYCDLLKYKPNETVPRGYPDAYFDGRTWDFKVSKSRKEDTLRQLIKDGRKADNLVFITDNESQIIRIQHALERELGRRINSGTWLELPDTYCLFNRVLIKIWSK